MTPQGVNIDRSFVWIFEFGSLELICDLIYGAWYFHDTYLAVNINQMPI